jgi:hypothetical protein
MSGATLVAFINGSTGGAGAGVFDFTEPGTGFIAIPTGATGVAIQVWGAGGGGGAGTFGFIAPGEPEIFPGGGGGGGGYAKTVLTFSAQDGKTINYTVGSGGAGGPFGSLSGDAGTFSNVFSGTYSLTTLTGNGGQGGTSGNFPVQGDGGTATGGNTTNTTGNGGAAFEQSGAAGVAGDASLTAGAGGDGGLTFDGQAGSSGRVRFVFTF